MNVSVRKALVDIGDIGDDEIDNEGHGDASEEILLLKGGLYQVHSQGEQEKDDGYDQKD